MKREIGAEAFRQWVEERNNFLEAKRKRQESGAPSAFYLQKRKKGLRARSKKTEEEYSEEGGRRDVVASILSSRIRCEAGEVIGARTQRSIVYSGCASMSHDVHERLPRSAGGSITDYRNLIAVCRPCHEWIHRNPLKAREIGLLSSRYGGDDE